MRLESLTVELRPRSNWEAMELGTALVRRHAGAIWGPWLIATGAVFIALNAACLAIGRPGLALLLMWWLRPLFDRIPLYVVSRAVFGGVPRTGETLRAQLSWGWKAMLGYLTWRRFSPFRAAMLPIDLLEGANATQLRERRRVIGAGSGGQAALLMIVCGLFVVALFWSLAALPLFFVNEELMSEAVRSAWSTLLDRMPSWLVVVFNAIDWIAFSLIEPFFVGAGFGLYLNRRTQLEAWDVEIAFRRMRRRLDALAGAALLALVCALTLASPSPAQAFAGADAAPLAMDARESKSTAGDLRDEGDGKSSSEDNREDGDAGDGEFGVDHDGSEAPPSRAEADTRTLEQVFGRQKPVDPGAFRGSVDRAAKDPLLQPKETVSHWERRVPEKKRKPKKMDTPDLSFLGALSSIFGFVAENLLWILLGVGVIALAMTARRWWPWMRSLRVEPEPEPEPVEVQAIPRDEPLPPDIAATARRLWAQGQPRRALALLYRASVEAVTARAGAHLPPGATESECLRVARRLPEPMDRDAFQRMVRVWQYAAYGHTLPEPDDFDALLATLAQRFGWSA